MVAVHQRGAKETLYFPLCHHHGTIPPSSSTQQNVEKDVVWWWLRTSTTETTRQTNKSCFPIFCLKKPTILFFFDLCFSKRVVAALIWSVWWQQLSSSLLQRKEERCRIHFEDWRSFCQFEVWQYVLLLDGPLVHNLQSHQLQLPANNHISHLIKTSQ